MVLFANYKTIAVATDDKGKKFKGQGGRRVMYTTHHPCWDGKNRFGLPEELPLDFAPLAHLFQGNTSPAVIAPAPVEEEPAPPVVDLTPVATEEKSVQTNQQSVMEAPTPTTPAAQSVEDTSVPRAKSDMDVPAVLEPMLKAADVTEEEVREVIAKRQGCFPMGTTWKVMEETGFVEGWILPFWDKIVQMILEKPDRLPF